MRRKEIDRIATGLLLISGLIWAIYGVFDINLVGTVFSYAPMLAQIVYISFGLASVYGVWRWLRDHYSPKA